MPYLPPPPLHHPVPDAMKLAVSLLPRWRVGLCQQLDADSHGQPSHVLLLRGRPYAVAHPGWPAGRGRVTAAGRNRNAGCSRAMWTGRVGGQTWCCRTEGGSGARGPQGPARMSDDLAPVVSRVRNQIVQVSTSAGLRGFFVTPSCSVVTARHAHRSD